MFGGKYLPWISQKQLHELIFLVVQPRFAVWGPQLIGAAIQSGISERQAARGVRAASSGEGAHTRQKLARVKGLRQIIVRTRVQPRHAVFYFRFRRQKQCGRRNASRKTAKPSIPGI